MEKRDLRKDGTIVWVRLTRSCVRKSDGSVDYFVAVVEDISARKRAEEQLHLLMREANHRVKNLLSLVQAIARQTAAGNVEGFIGRFTERIQALAANQDLLGRDEWQGADRSGGLGTRSPRAFCGPCRVSDHRARFEVAFERNRSASHRARTA